MTTKRFAGTLAAAFLVSQLLAITVHGYVLAADYAPFYGTLLRKMEPEGAWRMLFLPLSHLSFVFALVWFFVRIRVEGTPLVQGLKLGAVGFLVGQLPLWLLWYAEQPWPGTLVVKQLVLELTSSLIIGATIGVVARRTASAGSPALAGAAR
jgi:hypothetical protein